MTPPAAAAEKIPAEQVQAMDLAMRTERDRVAESGQDTWTRRLLAELHQRLTGDYGMEESVAYREMEQVIHSTVDPVHALEEAVLALRLIELGDETSDARQVAASSN